MSVAMDANIAHSYGSLIRVAETQNSCLIKFSSRNILMGLLSMRMRKLTYLCVRLNDLSIYFEFK